MVWHPHIVVPKLVLFVVIVVVLLVLHGALTPEQFSVAVVVAAVLFVAVSVLIWVVFLRKLKNPGSALARDMILKSSMSDREGFQASTDALAHLDGKTGVALSVLRPSGTAQIEGKRVSVTTTGAFIDAGARVEVVSVVGSRVVVREAPAPDQAER